MVIYKYPIQITDRQIVEMPKQAEILCVQVQREVPCLWALVNLDGVMAKRTILVYGTGHPVPDSTQQKYIGTIQLNGGSLVFHVFEEV